MIINLIKEQWIEIGLSKTRKKFISDGIILCFSLLLVGCSFYSKDTYLEDFSEFVTDVEQNYQSYSEEDWLSADQEYEEYVGETYNNFRAKLTDEDKKQVGKLKAKYQTVKIKHETGKMINDVSDGINQLQGVIEGVIGTINNQ